MNNSHILSNTYLRKCLGLNECIVDCTQIHLSSIARRIKDIPYWEDRWLKYKTMSLKYIKYSELSKLLTGKSDNIRKDRVPEKYKALIKRLELEEKVIDSIIQHYKP